MQDMSVWQKITSELVAPKNRNNTFGGYKYRSCEDILEAVKPLLKKNGCNLLLTDEVVCVGNANYIKATARLFSADGLLVEACGWAREEINKKGMDAPQMTGTASSYARKYALNGLFCIDDTKDADTNEYRTENDARAKQAQQQKQATAQPQERKRIPITLAEAKEHELGFMSWLYQKYQFDKNIDVEKTITDNYECDFATESYLRDKFKEYKEQMQTK